MPSGRGEGAARASGEGIDDAANRSSASGETEKEKKKI